MSKLYHANISVYLFKANALYYALEKLISDNAQHEEYLTDAVEILTSSNYKICSVPVNSKYQVMAFNSPEELESLKEYFVNYEVVNDEYGI